MYLECVRMRAGGMRAIKLCVQKLVGDDQRQVIPKKMSTPYDRARRFFCGKDKKQDARVVARLSTRKSRLRREVPLSRFSQLAKKRSGTHEPRRHHGTLSMFRTFPHHLPPLETCQAPLYRYVWYCRTWCARWCDASAGWRVTLAGGTFARICTGEVDYPEY